MDEFLIDSGNVAAGFGDTLTSGFGLFDTSLTEMAREALGSNGTVDKCSGAYAWGATVAGAASASALNNGIIVNGTRALQVHKHSLSMKILQNAGYSRKAALIGEKQEVILFSEGFLGDKNSLSKRDGDCFSNKKSKYHGRKQLRL